MPKIERLLDHILVFFAVANGVIFLFTGNRFNEIVFWFTVLVLILVVRRNKNATRP